MLWIGTSGYDYPEWTGSFYPAELSAAKRLSYYASRLNTVEINYTFYHLPSIKSLEGWIAQTPDTFRLTLKAPRRITHVARLRNTEPLLGRFCELAAVLGPRRGALLVQLPPFLKKDLATLRAFLDDLPAGARAAIEFRHPSWFDEDVFDALRRADAALCVSDGGKVQSPVRATASFAYLRLRDQGYGRAELEKWAASIRSLAAETDDVFVYFKHEEAGKGAEFAQTVARILERRAA